MLEKVESFDRFAPLRNKLRYLALKTGHWAGIPMPLNGQPLIIEPRFPTAKVFEPAPAPPDPEEDNLQLLNRFHSTKKGRHVVIFRDKRTGKIDWGTSGRVHHGAQLLQTLGASDAWGIEQEGRAVQTLCGLLRHRQFKQYMLTGMFLESSRRSGVMYMFRRLRPTIALSMRGSEARILAALCMHPIGHYEDSWAGAMCPTDDVIAHLMLMRGDEHTFWKRSNQIPAWAPEAGL